MFEWEVWMKNKNKCENTFRRYLQKEMIKTEEEKDYLSNSHLERAEYNLDFVNDLIENKKFYSWTIVGCYYVIYHSALSLLSKKGYSSKNHLATLCALIHLYYNHDKRVSEEDIKLIVKSSIDKKEINYFVEAKNKRETASYGVGKEFTKEEAIILRKDTIDFLNKVREILE
jgi:uncharacterized protein (UPF0332 family)